MPESAPQATPPAAPDPRVALAAWYLRRRHRTWWLLLMTTGLVLCIALLFVRGTAEDPRENLKASQAAWLALAPPAVPKEENAAEDYALAQKAKVLFPMKGSGWNDHPHSNLTRESKFFEDPAVQAYVANNATAIQHLYAGAAKTHCNWGLNYALGYNLSLPHLAEMRDNARLLAIDARVAAHAGDHQAAAKSIAAIYKLAQHVNTDPLLICGLVSIACAGIADGAVQSIIAWDTPNSTEGLAAYRKAVWQERRPAIMAGRFLAGEKASWLYSLDAMASGAMPVSGLAPGQSMASPLWYGSDRHCFVGVMDEVIAKASRGEWLEEKDFDDLLAKHQTGPVVITSGIIPVFNRTVINYLRGEEQARVTDAGLAFLQFRVKYGRDAKSLDELVPEFLPAVPVGAFHPQPLRMRVDPKGVGKSDRGKVTYRDPGTIRIYTLSMNGKDGGGFGWDSYEQNHRADEESALFLVPPIKRSDSAPGGKAP